MDRIKQALDKAREEQRTQRQSETAGSGSDVNHASHDALEVKYSQTRVQPINAAVLRNNKVIFGEGDKIGLSAYKMLRTQVLQRMTAKGWNALAVTSPAANDGKSLTAINLAISLARELHHTVLLVDMDLRKPSIHEYFGIKPVTGLSDYFLGDAKLGDILVNPGLDRLVLLPGRAAVENSSEILASPEMGVLVRELKARYPNRMVIFDLPPVLEADDALSFSPFVDAFLLVLRDGRTTRTAVEHAIEMMEDMNILGTVLNASTESVNSYY